VFGVERDEESQAQKAPARKSLLGLADSDPSILSGQEEPLPAGRSLLGLEEPARPAPRRAEDAGLETEAGREMFDLERKDDRIFPVERAILFSLAAHIILLVLLLNARFAVPTENDARRGILGALIPPEKSAEEKIPIVFKEAPGPSRQNPKASALSDATRRAGGGDPSRPKSIEPFVPERPGKVGLEPGSKAAQSAPRPPSSGARPAQQSAAQAAAPGQEEKGGPDAFRVPPPGREAATREGSKLANLDRAIQEAAKGVGAAAGAEGSGFPNPEGGFVDSGPISFDTTWYDWGAYAEEMVRRIKLHWEIPELARLGWKGKLSIRFFIRGDGRVEGARILSVSGVPPFDHAALQAILTSNPFRPLPKDLGSDREGVTVTFFYNIRPGKNGEEQKH